jgi:hypothetical protein
MAEMHGEKPPIKLRQHVARLCPDGMWDEPMDVPIVVSRAMAYPFVQKYDGCNQTRKDDKNE